MVCTVEGCEWCVLWKGVRGGTVVGCVFKVMACSVVTCCVPVWCS